MKYAKIKSDKPTHFFSVDENYSGISIFIHGDSAAISTYNNGAKWFGKIYEICSQKEFENALQEAKQKLNI